MRTSRARSRGLGLALLLHVVARGVGLVVLILMAQAASQEPVERLAVWDGGWYLRIVQDGYASDLDLEQESTGSLAFFPLYPALIRLVSVLPGLDAVRAGVLLSELAAAVAAAGLFVLVERLYDRRVAVAAVLLWSTQPLSIVLSMVYTEALFTALAVWALYLLHERRWLSAGVLGLLAGLTRSTGLAVGAAVAGFALWTWWRSSRRDVRPLVAAVLALAGTPLWWAAVGFRVGQANAWFVVQDTFWESRWDWGTSMFDLGRKLFTQEVRYSGEAVFVTTVTFALLLLAIALLVEAVGRRMWWPLLVYAAVALALTLGSAGVVNAKPRFLVPLFPLLIPLAVTVAGASRRAQVLTGLLLVVTSAWFGAYLLVVWPYSI